MMPNRDNVKISRVGDCAAADDYIDEVLANVAKMVVEQVSCCQKISKILALVKNSEIHLTEYFL